MRLIDAHPRCSSPPAAPKTGGSPPDLAAMAKCGFSEVTSCQNSDLRCRGGVAARAERQVGRLNAATAAAVMPGKPRRVVVVFLVIASCCRVAASRGGGRWSRLSSSSKHPSGPAVPAGWCICLAVDGWTLAAFVLQGRAGWTQSACRTLKSPKQNFCEGGRCLYYRATIAAGASSGGVRRRP